VWFSARFWCACFSGNFTGEIGKADFERKICEDISAVQAGEIMINGLPSGISEEINDKCRDNRTCPAKQVSVWCTAYVVMDLQV
jgi:hypothetical protein